MSKQKLLLIYIAFGIAWVFLTDYLIDAYITDHHMYMWIQKTKGILFVLFSGALIYFFLAKSEKFSELKEEEKRLSTLINSMVDFVNFKDGDGRWIEANKFGLKLFQLENVKYKGLKDSELASYSNFYNEALRYCEVSDEETWIEKEITRCEEIVPLPNGDYKTFDTIKVPLFNSDGSRKGLVVIGRDITERVRAQRKLSDSQQQYKSLFEYNPDPVFMINMDCMITNINPQFELVIGMSNTELIGRSIHYFVKSCEKHENILIDSFSYVHKNKTGVNTGDITFKTKGGKTLLLNCTLVPMLIDGEIAGIIGYAKDVTVMRETAERLRKTEKLSVVGELAASVAHEVRNPLTSLKGFVQLLKDSESTYQTYYSIMLNELDRINQIVSELLVLAKPQEQEFKKHNLVHLLSDVKALLEPQANYDGAQIEIKVENEIPFISCEANQLKQVFINIIKNSIEASAQKIIISLKREDDTISIAIVDDGSGIESARIKHLGEPFYSSKEKGTGLGLTVTYRIIQAHDGKVEFHSEIKKGTEVKISLPVN